jgi:hypothetical protein
MSGFPLEFRDDVLGPPDEDGCHVSAHAIAQYLKVCAYHLLDDEPPQTYGPLTPVLHRAIGRSGFWIWTCWDRDSTPWFVMAGTACGFAPRWLFAETQEGRTAEEFLQDTLDEIQRGARKSRSRPRSGE